ncbi:site-specific DNA-methyltransferase [Mycoplasma buteonis]|uniref:site-specific DNA-methyltransferase n=1 Tax=Mycoplasma buteonis TaxID=171280 RepID=UPI000563B424|nr:site-specific DNA-methyltransferase [Mycoplasma buteonis]
MENKTNINKLKIKKFLEDLKNSESLSVEQLQTINEIERFINAKKFGLVYENYFERVEELAQNNFLALEGQQEKTIAANKDKPINYLIEGDNFLALKLLQKTHKNRVDVIYIDPPYNTGNKDFVYNDSFVGIDDAFRHSKWLSFMEKRLNLAKNLLKEDGVIFISIDDNEQAHLKLLCDEIFGERNHIQTFLWNKNSGGSSLSKFTRSDYEYIHCYAKNISAIKYEFVSKLSVETIDASLFNNPNKYAPLFFDANIINFKNIKQGVIKPFKADNFELLDEIIIENSKNKNSATIWSKWKWSQEKLENEIKLGTRIISKTQNLRLRYEKTPQGNTIKPTKSITKENNVGYTVTGSSELQKYIGKNDFSFPKPTSLIQYLINMVTYNKKDFTVLDFFAGSGTTGHAVQLLNQQDSGNRQYILCTNNENNIAEDVTYKRLSKIQNELPHNLKYLKVKFYNKESVAESDELYTQFTESFSQLIELENNLTVNRANNEIIFLNTEEDFFKISITDLLKAKIIYKDNVFHWQDYYPEITNEQMFEINSKTHYLPNYYYDSEMKE